VKELPLDFQKRPSLADTVMDRKDLKELLLFTHGRMISQGNLWDIKSKSLGAGVYRVFLELYKKEEQFERGIQNDRPSR